MSKATTDLRRKLDENKILYSRFVRKILRQTRWMEPNLNNFNIPLKLVIEFDPIMKEETRDEEKMMRRETNGGLF